MIQLEYLFTLGGNIREKFSQRKSTLSIIQLAVERCLLIIFTMSIYKQSKFSLKYERKSGPTSPLGHDLSGQATLHDPTVEVRVGSLVHRGQAVGHHKGGSMGQGDGRGAQRVEFNELCCVCASRLYISVIHKSKFLESL